jgi:triacylglycerol esterase/lipase EstA (alpha/beta hydrolase family)
MKRKRTGTLGSACAVAIAVCCLGCSTTRHSSGFAFTTARSNISTISDWRRSDAEKEFDDAVALLANDESMLATVQTARDAEIARRDADPRCVDLYANVALECWPRLSATSTAEKQGEIAAATWTAYHYSVAQLVRCATIHGRLDPAKGISLAADSDSSTPILITHHSFPWSKQDFNQLNVITPPSESGLARYWTKSGLGVPLIAVRQRDKSEGFLGQTIPFSATAILRPQTPHPALGLGNTADASRATGAVLELHDPIRVEQVSYAHGHWDLARDISAPLQLANAIVNRDKIQNFLNPGRNDEAAGLRMIEPYQPGKVPVVLGHGLLSDKFTWLDLANDLRSVPGFHQKYQVWAFQYPTGQTFIRSAAEMRHGLTQIVQHLDPGGSDPALSQMVLIGHSMGGLVSKLQITGSDSEIWDSVAKRKFEEIDTTPEIRREIESVFFFEPLPFVKRVVFIGSPHQGSQMATGFLGKLGSALVMAPQERVSMLQNLVAGNPDAFAGEVTERLPSSVELLRPDNPVLLATYKLRVNPAVRLHTIIGTGGELSDGTPADGVVSVASARHPGTVSERRIDATHTQLTSHPETTIEVVRILKEHLRQLSGPAAVVASVDEQSPLPHSGGGRTR